jgi:hypothetical protein
MPLLPFSDASPPTTNASLLTSGTLADARLSSNVALDNVNNSFTSGQTITAPANTSALTATYSVTGANTTPLVSLTGTWNTTGLVTGIKLNVTNTAFGAASVLLDLATTALVSTVLTTRSYFQFTAGTSGSHTNSQFWMPNPQATIVQSTSNYERGFMRWNSNTLEIGTEAGGTGTVRRVKIQSAESIDFVCANSFRSIGTAQNQTTIFNSTNWIHYSGAADPTTSTSPFNNGAGTCAVYRNTTTGVVRLWVNNNGTMVSVALA